MRQRSFDIGVVAALALIAAALACIVPPNWVPGRILALLLVLVLPGYALTSALFARRALGVPERLVFILGLSLVIVILGGLVLNWTPFGLQASSWAVLLSVITLAASAVALIRRQRQGLPITGWPRIRDLGLTFRLGLLLGLAAAVLSSAVVISSIGAAQQPRPGFTQLWMLPAGAKDAIRLGVSNLESRAMGYRLALNEGGKVVKEWPAIDLKPNEKWQATLVLPPTGHAGTVRVEALLYRKDAPATIYRDVVLWLGT